MWPDSFYWFIQEMGVYLSTPKTEKLSEDGENDKLRFGLSSMQGWRASMEDAVSSLPTFSLFDLIYRLESLTKAIGLAFC